MGDMTPETPLRLLSHAVDCLTKISEDESVPVMARECCERLREGALDVRFMLRPEKQAAA